MKNKLLIILIFFTIYFCSFFFYGKNSLGIEIIKSNTIYQKQDSIQVQLYNLKDYIRNQAMIKSVLKEKGFNFVAINYAENFFNENKYCYWLEIQELVPLVAFAYDGHFKKGETSEEFETLYIWCFFKWIRIYKKDNSKN